MSWLRRLLPGRNASGPAEPIVLDTERRTAQLQRLEDALDALVEAMKAGDRMANPGWKERVAEYKRQSGTAYTLRRGGFTLLRRTEELEALFDRDVAAVRTLPELVRTVMRSP